MTDTMADRRGAPRYPFVLSAEVLEVSSGARFQARTSDISRTGCYIDTLQPVPRGSAVRVSLTYQGAVLKLYGTVTYVNAGFGIGIRFGDGLLPDQVKLLESWLETAARQPA